MDTYCTANNARLLFTRDSFSNNHLVRVCLSHVGPPSSRALIYLSHPCPSLLAGISCICLTRGHASCDDIPEKNSSESKKRRFRVLSIYTREGRDSEFQFLGGGPRANASAPQE